MDLNSHTTIEGSLDSCVMGFSSSGLGKMSMMLRDDIYTEKELAVMREYICNAVDEHITHGVDSPVQVHIPSMEEPWFSVRDFGRGLSKKDIFNVFFQFFESSKENDKKTAGQFGIGAKSFACISDLMVVTSYHEGVKSVYAGVVVGNNSEGHLNESEPSNEPSGIEIVIHLKERDIARFINMFGKFYSIYRGYQELVVLNWEEKEFKTKTTELYGGAFVGDESFGYLTNDRICYKGVLYTVPWPITPIYKQNAIIFVDDSINIDLHPSREKIQKTERNQDIVNALFEKARQFTFEVFASRIPFDFFEKWAFLVQNKKLATFYKENGAKGLEKLKEVLTFTSTDLVWFYRYENGDLQKIKGTRKYSKHISELDVLNNGVRVHYLPQNIGAGYERAIKKEFGYTKAVFVTLREKPLDAKAGLEEIKEFFEVNTEESSALLIDRSDLQPLKVEREKKVKTLSGIRCFDFYQNCFEKRDFSSKDETIYWLPVINKDLEVKGMSNHQVCESMRSLKINIIGLNRSNRKDLPENFVSALPLLKAMRRHAYKAKNWSLQEIIPIHYKLSDYQYSFLGTKNKRTFSWPFPIQKKKFKLCPSIAAHNAKIEKINKLMEENMEFYTLAIAIKETSKFSGQIKEKMLELVK